MLPAAGASSSNRRRSSVRALLEGLPELWDEKEYDRQFDLGTYISKNNNKNKAAI